MINTPTSQDEEAVLHDMKPALIGGPAPIDGTPHELQAARSPLDVSGIDLGMTTEEITEFIHEGRGNHHR